MTPSRTRRGRRPAPVPDRPQWIAACEWRIGEPGLEELRIVERAGLDGIRYAVKWISYVANRDYEWEIEPIPSSRDDAFMERCRFANWEEAYQVAIRMPLDSTGVRVD